ncbi:MMPL family transporter [Singulisphaera acidiphila]|uniref:Putative RND superfamily drug exporter n=1 Tax=Singulisphaera acidiphila (strain ATCC BAA-1392 / DSM 18658 / VKM B-2454 / MOB10) TaxID=886293 RepID=L0D9M9_SINAD|nr:MMPL family transporter [Singulisphaera acidiphila]AGA26099.1 putative RND superfamily drug exporter [Singulisphaera acidiphila DSM 18658]
MNLDFWRRLACRRPGWVVSGWFVVAIAVGLFAPNLTQLAAEGQAKLLGRDSESLKVAQVVAKVWPDQGYESMAVVGFHRPGGLTESDREYASQMAKQFAAPTRPNEILRVLGPDSQPEVADRLLSRDRSLELVAVPMRSAFVAPVTQEAVAWLQTTAVGPTLSAPSGLEILWSGDAVLGRDYMASVQTSLDRAALVTVFLLFAVLLAVYRSVWLALVPLATIGLSLVITRGILAWMTQLGWEISPLVELFLVAILFGTGTDFCLFVSWRFGEHFNPDNPAGAMQATLERSSLALLTSAGTVIVGLSLMGTTHFKLFSSTGPSVAIGLVLTLMATLTLTPALLVLLAGLRPRSFRGLTAPASGIWEKLGRMALSRPLLSWSLALLFMAPLALLSLRADFVQDLMTELPRETRSAQCLRLIAEKFEPGMMAPLTVVLESDADFRSSEGLALIDDVSRFLTLQRRLVEVRSATQPLGRTETLARARLASRLGEVNEGFVRMASGAGELRKGLIEGAAKIRAALWLEQKTGLKLMNEASTASSLGGVNPAPSNAGNLLAQGFRQASAAFVGSSSWSALKPAADPVRTPPSPAGTPKPEPPRQSMLRDLSRAADGAAQIEEGAERAHREVSSILANPVGRRALDRLLIDAQTLRDNPDLGKSLAAYITKSGHRARIDLVQADRVFSAGAMDQVQSLRQRLNDYLSEVDGMKVKATIGGANAESADIRALTRSDQIQSWFVVPIGVFLVLLVALRDPLACLNLVATMILTYMFALGATHLVFVSLLGAEGLDWKVPYFLFVLLVAVGVDYNVFLMDRVREESRRLGLRAGIIQAIAKTGGLISSAAAITACSFASFLSSPLGSLRQLGFALVVGITLDAVLVRPILVPCGHWLLSRVRWPRPLDPTQRATVGSVGQFVHVSD